MLNETFSVIFKHRALCFLNSKMYLHLCESGIDAENVVFVPQNPRILSSQNPVDFASEWEFAIDMNFPWDLVSLQEEKEKDFFGLFSWLLKIFAYQNMMNCLGAEWRYRQIPISDFRQYLAA